MAPTAEPKRRIIPYLQKPAPFSTGTDIGILLAKNSELGITALIESDETFRYSSKDFNIKQLNHKQVLLELGNWAQAGELFGKILDDLVQKNSAEVNYTWLIAQGTAAVFNANEAIARLQKPCHDDVIATLSRLY